MASIRTRHHSDKFSGCHHGACNPYCTCRWQYCMMQKQNHTEDCWVLDTLQNNTPIYQDNSTQPRIKLQTFHARRLGATPDTIDTNSPWTADKSIPIVALILGCVTSHCNCPVWRITEVGTHCTHATHKTSEQTHQLQQETTSYILRKKAASQSRCHSYKFFVYCQQVCTHTCIDTWLCHQSR